MQRAGHSLRLCICLSDIPSQTLQSPVGKAKASSRPFSRLNHHFDRDHHDPQHSLGCDSLHNLLLMQYSSLADSSYYRRFSFLYQQLLYSSDGKLNSLSYLAINFRPFRSKGIRYTGHPFDKDADTALPVRTFRPSIGMLLDIPILRCSSPTTRRRSRLSRCHASESPVVKRCKWIFLFTTVFLLKAQESVQGFSLESSWCHLTPPILQPSHPVSLSAPILDPSPSMRCTTLSSHRELLTNYQPITSSPPGLARTTQSSVRPALSPQSALHRPRQATPSTPTDLSIPYSTTPLTTLSPCPPTRPFRTTTTTRIPSPTTRIPQTDTLSSSMRSARVLQRVFPVSRSSRPIGSSSF